MFRNYRKCYCMNNTYRNNNCELQNDVMENKCDNVASYEESMNSCDCGFDEEYNVFPYMDKTFKPCVGLKMGTIFPELVSPYVPCQSMEEINYIRETNEIGKGCNKCQ